MPAPEPPDFSSGRSPRAAELPRLLGAWSAASILIGSIIGSGIFVKPGVVARDLPSPGWILVCWLVAGLLALIGSLVFAELGSLHPNAGGQYTFLREAFGKLTAFLFGWTTLLIVNAASIAALAVISAKYFFHLFPADFFPESLRPAPDGHLHKGIAVLAIAFLTLANIAGLRWGAAIQNILTLLKLGAVAAIIAGLFAPSAAGYSNLSPFWEIRGAPAMSQVWAGFKGAFLAILWAYDGWYLLSFSGGEIHNPRRNIPLGFVSGILVVITAYLLVNVSYLCLIDLEAMKGFTEGGGVAAEAAMRLYGQVGLTMISAGILGSTFGAANGNLLTGPRLSFAMARDGTFFRQLSRLHPRFQTPALAIGLQGAAGAIYVYLGSFNELTDAVVFAAWTFYLLTVIAYFVLRRRHQARRDVFRSPGYPVLPVIFVVFAAAFLAYSLFESAGSVARFIDDPAAAGAREGIYPAVVAAMMLAGLPIYWILQRKERPHA
jgi:APA family basic amino acid/polyamine antiporter